MKKTNAWERAARAAKRRGTPYSFAFMDGYIAGLKAGKNEARRAQSASTPTTFPDKEESNETPRTQS